LSFKEETLFVVVGFIFLLRIWDQHILLVRIDIHRQVVRFERSID
jgi:hypothetical protein